MFRVRFLTALVGVPMMLLVISWGAQALRGLPFVAAVAFLVVVGLKELYGNMWRKQIRPVCELGYAASVALLLVVWYVRPSWQGQAIGFILAATVAGALVAHLGVKGETSPAQNVGGTVLGVIWVGLLFTYFLRLRQLDLAHVYPWLRGDDAWSFFRRHCGPLIVTFAAAWLSDTMAFAVGKTLGKHKLCPYLSPGKTIEGTIGGFLGATIFGALAAALMAIPVVHGAALGAIIGVIGQLGGLSQSAIKRDFQIKDFGTLFPGHGGVMDRFDGILFAMPAAFLYFKLFILM